MNDSVSSYDHDLAATGQRQISFEEAELFSLAASADFLKLPPNEPEESYFDNKMIIPEEVDYKYNMSDEKLSESTIGSPHSSFNNETFNEPVGNTYIPRKTREGYNRRLKVC